jgi:hypothetical protein
MALEYASGGTLSDFMRGISRSSQNLKRTFLQKELFTAQVVTQKLNDKKLTEDQCK